MRRQRWATNSFRRQKPKRPEEKAKAKRRAISCEQFLNDFSMDIRQPKIPSLKAIRQLRVIEAKQMQHRRVQIVNVNFVHGRVKAEVIRFAERDAAFDPTASEPHRETIRMVIAAIAV